MDCYRYEKGSTCFILSSKSGVHNNASYMEDAEETFIEWDKTNGPIQGEESKVCV